jgi:STE24 endopeptidase
VVLSVPEGAQARPGVRFDPEAATEAWLATVPPEARARSDAYFEGGYWLQPLDTLVGAGVMLLLLATGLSRRMRERAERVSRHGAVQTFLYWVQYLAVTTALSFPLAVYTDFVREHRFGLSTQTFAAWAGEQAKGLAVSALLGGLFVTALYGVVRRSPRAWPVWGAATALVFMAVSVALGPVFIAPLFNTYSRLEEPSLREPILRMARANGVVAEDVFVSDASRQSTRISANVSGMLGTERITLNDNLLRRTSPEEVQAVMGHELGHYVLNHVYEMLLFLAVVLVAGFALLRTGFERAQARWGARWGVRGVGDPAGLPLVVLLLSLYGAALAPLFRSFVRTNEMEADVFGLNAARQPDAFAQVSLRLGEYRKLAPGPLEEWFYFDHPSGRTRILTAMRWKAAQLEAQRAAPAVPPVPPAPAPQGTAAEPAP